MKRNFWKYFFTIMCGFLMIPSCSSASSKLSITPSSLELHVEDTYQLKVNNIVKWSGDDLISWQSTDTKIATVSQKGLVKAISIGNCNIKALTSSGLSASCAIKVVSDSEEITPPSPSNPTTPTKPTEPTEPSNPVTPSVRKYTIRFNTLGGSCSYSSLTKTENYPLDIPTEEPTRYGYLFYGWNSFENNNIYRAGDQLNINKDMTLYAMWGKACEHCHGETEIVKIDCSSCKGKGTVDVYGDGTCPNCNGSGRARTYEDCRTCAGLGHLSIWGCVKGHRIRATSYDEYYTYCPTCLDLGMGSRLMAIYGHYDCPYCEDGKIYGAMDTCQRCKGDGIASVVIRTDPCEHCLGSGKQSRNKICRHCLGNKMFGEGDALEEVAVVDDGDICTYEVNDGDYEYALIRCDSLKEAMDEKYQPVLINNAEFTKETRFVTKYLYPMVTSYDECFIFAKRKASTSSSPYSLVTDYVIIDRDNKIYYKQEDVAKNYTYKVYEVNNDNYEKLSGKSFAIISGMDKERGNGLGAGIDASFEAHYPINYYALTSTERTNDKKHYAATRVNFDGKSEITSSVELETFYLSKHSSRSHCYKITSNKTGRTLYGIKNGYDYYISFAGNGGSSYYDNYWLIMNTGGRSYLYAIVDFLQDVHFSFAEGIFNDSSYFFGSGTSDYKFPIYFAVAQ